MRIKKSTLFLASSALLLPLFLVVILFSTRTNLVSASRSYPTYQLHLNSGNQLVNGENLSGTKTYKTELNNNVTFSYKNISSSTGEFAVLVDDTSYIKNSSALNGLVSIDYSLSSGSIYIDYGWSADTYENKSSALSSEGTFSFNQEYPSFFKITSTETASISYLNIKYSCEASINPYQELQAPANPNTEHQYEEKVFVDFPVYTDDDATPGLSYTLSDDGTYYIVDNWQNTMEISEGNMIIFPNEHNGLPVKEIGRPGFIGRWWIFGIYVPENIERIQNEAFEQCGLTTIYWNARHCQDFEPRNAIFYPEDDHDHQNIDLVFGPAVEHIPARMLYPTAMNPTKLPRVHSISFSKNSKVTSIGDYAFYGVNGISSIHLPDSIKSIGDYAFYNLGVDEVKLPTSLESIGDYAFMFSIARYVSFPTTLNSIGEGAFNYAENILDINLSNTNVTEIKDNTFSHASSLSYITFPTSLERIGEEAFLECESLICANFPDSLTEVGVRAFKGCTSISYIYLGRDLVNLGNSAFDGLVNVHKLVIRSTSINDLTNNNKVFLSLGSNVNDLVVFFKHGVTSIPSYLFYPSSLEERLPHIARLVIPSSVNSIKDYTFFELSIPTVEFYGSIAEYDLISVGEHNTGLVKVKARGI